MSDLMKIGADWGGAGSFKPLTSGVSGAQRTTDAHARYMDATMAGRTYMLSVSAGAPTAYVGAAAGTPLLAVFNPANSNKYLIALFASFAQRAAASAVGSTGLDLWSGPSVAPTGTKTSPTNILSQAASGSAAFGFVNTALTGSTALTNVLPLATLGVAAAATALGLPGLYEVPGIVIASPGNMIALGLTVIPASLTADAALIWEEVPFLTQV